MQRRRDDSSGAGFGACERILDPKRCRDIGAVSEKWRNDFEDAVDARRHAPGKAHEATLSLTPDCEGVDEHNVEQLFGAVSSRGQKPFDDLPSDILKFDSWSVGFSQRWMFHENILRTEGRALVRCVRRNFLNISSHGARQ